MTKKLLIRIIKTIKQSIDILDKSGDKKKSHKKIVDEWKKVATRVDSILLWISGITIIAMPILLFSKFFFRDDPVLLSCGCTES